MRDLTVNEIIDVNGGLANATLLKEKILGYGATGALANMLLSGTTLNMAWQGFLLGGAVGGVLGLVLIVSNEL